MTDPLGILGLALAVPGLAAAFSKCGRYLEGRIDAFKDAPAILAKLKQFGHDLHAGKLKTDLELAEWAIGSPMIDSQLKTSLENQLLNLQNGLAATTNIFDRLINKNGEVKRIRFAVSGERKLKDSIKHLEKLQGDFWSSISLVNLRRNVPVQTRKERLLTNDKFQTFRDSAGRFDKLIEDNPNLRVSRAEIMDGVAARGMLALFEISPVTDGATKKEFLELLATGLSRSNRGVLKFIGYRETPRFQLVFEVPPNLDSPRTLDSLIAGDVEKGYAGARPLDHRFLLAKQIAEAVLSVHIAGLVHKNIRPATVVIFQTNTLEQNAGIGTPYLTHWSLLRQVGGLSTRGGNRDWQKNLYRHPERQGLEPESRYNMSHDIYSLGVILLEIGLWLPLIVASANGSRKLNDLYVAAAVNGQHVKPGCAEDMDSLTSCQVVQKILVDLANQELPQRMGNKYCDLVVKCLTCLEGGFGEDNQTAVGVQYNETVLSTLSKISF